jgi:hypothetical protein
MKYLQKLGKAIMLPVACLPLCGILMGVGYLLCPASMQGGEMTGAVPMIGMFLVKAGGALIDNIAVLFAVGVGVGMADETADNYAQVWGYSIGKLDPKNENRSILYILGGKYDPAAVQGMDKFLMKVMKTVLISGSTPDAKSRANFMKDRIENGVDMVFRDNIQSLVKDARKKLEEQ